MSVPMTTSPLSLSLSHRSSSLLTLLPSSPVLQENERTRGKLAWPPASALTLKDAQIRLSSGPPRGQDASLLMS